MDIMTISVILGAVFAFTFILEGFIRAIRATFGHLIHLASKLLQLCWTMTKAVVFDFPFYFYGAFKRALKGIEKATRAKPVKSYKPKKKPAQASMAVKTPTMTPVTEEPEVFGCSIFGHKITLTEEELEIPTAIRWGLVKDPNLN